MWQVREAFDRCHWLLLVLPYIFAGVACGGPNGEPPTLTPTLTATPTLSPTPTPTLVPPPETEIRALVQEYFKAWERGIYEEMYTFLKTEVERVVFVSNNNRLPIPVHGLSIENIDLRDDGNEATVVFNVRTPNWGCILAAVQSDDPVGTAKSLQDKPAHVFPQRDTLVLSKESGDWKINFKIGGKKSNRILAVLYELGFLTYRLVQGDKLAYAILHYVTEFEIPQDRFENTTKLLIEEMQRCVETSEQNEHCQRGFDALNREEYEQAISELSRCLDLHPDNVDAVYARGLANLGLMKHEDAAKGFTRTLELDPNRVAAYFYRGVAFSFLSQCERALEDFSETTKRDSNQKRRADAYEYSGDCLCDLGRCDQAIELYTKAILIPRPNILACISYYKRGKANKALGQQEEAIIDLQTARDLHEICQVLADRELKDVVNP